MNLIDNKKAHDLGGQGFIDCQQLECLTMNTLSQITVPFHNANLLVVNHNNQPYTPMKPIVDGMGLDWKSQYRKLVKGYGQNDHTPNRWGVTKIVIPTLGDLQEMVCLPLRKLFGWLMSISSNKVKPELRETVIKYQNECDDVLWDYWTKGVALNSRIVSCEKISPEQQTELANIVSRRAKGVRKVFAEMWSRHNKHFNIPRYSELYAIHFEDAKQYLENMVLRSDTGQADIVVDQYYQQSVQALAIHMLRVSRWWGEFGSAVKILNPDLAAILHDHFGDGARFACEVINESSNQKLQALEKSFPWFQVKPYQRFFL